MHKIYTLTCLFLFVFSAANAQTELIKYFTWDDETLPVASPGNLNLQYSGCWGMAVNGHEYGVLGGAGDILIFDVTEPEQSFLRNKFSGSAVTIWREFKSYKNRLYAVSDNAGEGLMIFDFSQAPDTIKRTYWSTDLFVNAHTITIDTVSGHIYLNGGSSGQGITILDASQNPDAPTALAYIPQLPGGYIHDSYVRNDTLYASSGYNGYFIYDFKTDIQNPTVIASTSTNGYNHNSWLTADGRYAYYTEEIPKGRPVQIVDLNQMTTLGEIETIGAGFLDNQVAGGTDAIPHNVYIKNNWLFNSQYEDGLLVYDISNPLSPVLAWKYDTHLQNTFYNGYFGNWGNYPWLPSGTIIAGDMQNGLFVLGFPPSVVCGCEVPKFKIYPNPAGHHFSVQFEDPESAGLWSYRLIDMAGRIQQTGQNIPGGNYSVNFNNNVFPGVYILEVTLQNGSLVREKMFVTR